MMMARGGRRASLKYNGTGRCVGSLQIGRCFDFVPSPSLKARVTYVPRRDIPSARERGARYLLCS